MQVLLFDIDGTLIRSGGAGKAAMEDALRDEFGLAEVHDGVPYSGRTDPSIARDLLTVHGIEPNEENAARLRTAYLRRLPETLKRYAGTVLPGVRELLDRLRLAENVAVGLLTGNIREGARCKLSHYDLWHHFPFGGFADDLHDRDDVARGAFLEIARHLKREIQPGNIWVIGDTPLDVKCARAIGARSVAVATGWHSMENLTAAQADWVFPDFSDPTALPREWQGPL
jgi:phosphoglycolate phosphatase-like HAD superfamily hydrolase